LLDSTAEGENSSEKELMEVVEESHPSPTDDSLKIDNELPVELMEVDEEVNSEEKVEEVNSEEPIEAEKSSNEDDSVSHENGINHEKTEEDLIDDPFEDKTDSDDQVKKSDSCENVIDDEKDLLDTLINSLDEPLASIDMEIPEALA
jgi:hypothetical protein